MADLYLPGAWAFAADPPISAPLPEGRQHRRPLLRAGRAALALGLVVALHLLLLMAWRARTPAFLRDALGQGGGAGGVALSLVRGASGANADDGHPTRATADPLQQQDTSASPQSAEPGPATRSGDDLAAKPEAGDSHGDGHVGDTAAGGAQAAAGAGYDRYAYASLAPLSFHEAAAPALADQLHRCLTSPLPVAVTLSVVLDDAGGFVDAYTAQDEGAGRPSLRTPEAIAVATEALKRCSPYRDVRGGLGHPLRLDLAAGPAS